MISLRRQIINIAFLVFVFCLPKTLVGQDPVFSQFYNAPMQLNPAFAGSNYNPYVALNYRNQWPGIANAYNTYAVSYDQFVEGMNSGFGLALLSDDAGDGVLKTNKLSGIYAYQLKIKDDLQLKIGIDASIVQLRLNWEKLIFFDQLDPQFGTTTAGGSPIPSQEQRPDNLSKRYFDISSGLLLFNENYYFGLSLKHLNTPDQSFIEDNLAEDELKTRIGIHGGYQIVLSPSNKRRQGSFLTPNVLFVRQGDFSQLNAGAYVSLGSFFAGGWYRYSGSNGDAFIVSAGISVGYLKIGYSFDYTISDLTISTLGSHEIGVIMNFRNARSKRSKYNDCLRLFR